MPKLVDHEQRRRDLATAVQQVILEGGVPAATVRAVARRAGLSPGALRHYFSTQQAMLHFTMQETVRDATQRIQELLRSDLPSRVTGQAILEQMLPMDATRRAEMIVWTALMEASRASGDADGLRERSWQATRQLCRLVASLLREQPVGPVTAEAPLVGLPNPRADAGLEAAAERLHVLVDGLAVQGMVYTDRMPPARLRTLLRRALEETADGCR